MGVLDWIVGLGVDKGLLRNPAKSINASEDEECRANMKCGFIDGISQEEFESIVIQIGNRFRRLSDVSVDGPLVNGTVYSQSGLSEWNFTIDFNDYGHLTGRYWLFTDNDDSNIPSYIANAISAAINDTLSNKTNENMIETNAYKHRIHLKKSLDRSNSDFDSNEKYKENRNIEVYSSDSYIPCCFTDGISKYDFQKIVKRVVKKYDRIEEMKIFDAKVYGLVRSHTGKSTWRFILDFNDGGHLTGLYRYYSKNEDSSIFIGIGDEIKEAILQRSVRIKGYQE